MSTKMQVILRTIERDGVPSDHQEVVSEMILNLKEETLELVVREKDEFHLKVRKPSKLSSEIKDDK